MRHVGAARRVLDRPRMALDEAHALVQSLLDETREPERRAKLVALQLALGWPYALEVTPARLLELRAREVAMTAPVVRAQVWLGAASLLAAVWCTLGSVIWTLLAWGDVTLIVIDAAFLIGVVHAVVGLVLAARRPRLGMLRTLGWMWLVAPAFTFTAALGFERDVLLTGTLCAAPSLLVAWTAARVAHHLGK